jgi:YHS domain-containing protein
MNKKTIALLATGLIVTLLVISSCQKKTEPAAPPPAAEANAAAAAEIEQTMCPVMEAPINKKIFTEYQGKKVYFCCGQCKAEFEKNPEKYLDKLPQFKK